MTKLKIGIVNTSSKVKDSDVRLIARACNRQIQHTLATAYNKVVSPVQFFPGKTITPDWCAIVLTDKATYPDALGFHTENGGIVSGEIDVDIILGITGASVLGDKTKPLSTPSVASVISHEVCELFIDPNCQLWADGTPIQQGSSYAYECCDPVESNSFFETVDKKFVQLSDLVLPAWFDLENTTGPYNFLNTLKNPFAIDNGGYVIIRNAPGSEQAVFNDEFNEEKLNHKKRKKSRTLKRLK